MTISPNSEALALPPLPTHIQQHINSLNITNLGLWIEQYAREAQADGWKAGYKHGAWADRPAVGAISAPVGKVELMAGMVMLALAEGVEVTDGQPLFAGSAPMAEPVHQIITLCGSARFEKLFKAWNEALTMAGHTVFGLTAYPSDKAGVKQWYSDEQKEALDAAHFRKIEASNSIFVINRNAYIGHSTMNEINHARKHGKTIYFLESWGEGNGPLDSPSPIDTTTRGGSKCPWSSRLLGPAGALRNSIVALTRGAEEAMPAAHATSSAVAASPDVAKMVECDHAKHIVTGHEKGYYRAWCDACGLITHAADGFTVEMKGRSDFSDWCNRRVAAYGCSSEVTSGQGGVYGTEKKGPCASWCGSTACAVSLRAATQARGAASEPPKAKYSYKPMEGNHED